jgi:uncharacterized protein YjiK
MWRGKMKILTIVLILSLTFTVKADIVLYGAHTSTTTPDKLVTIDPSTASYQIIGNFDYDIQGLAYAPDMDILWGLSAQTKNIYSIDRNTGAITSINPIPHSFGNANGLAYDLRNQRLIASSNDGILFAIDPISGDYSYISNLQQAGNIEGLGYDYTTDTLFGIADLENQIVSIDLNSGICTPIIDLPSLNWRGLEFDPFKRVLYASVSLGGNFYEINPFGEPSFQFIGYTSIGTQGLAIIPESYTLSLLTLGAMLAGRRRKM